MAKPNHLFRAARRLQAAWNVRARRTDQEAEQALDRLRTCHERLTRARQLLAKAETHHITTVLPGLYRNVQSRLQALGQAVEDATEQLGQQPTPVPDEPTLLAELRQLEDEFDGLTVDLR